ncbi:MAG TPA: ATP-binding protein [Gaiellaceae bacterium]|nr:ATP-binding protein [Gaiellaceae bacterium]
MTADVMSTRLELYLPADESAIVQARRAVERVDALAKYPAAQFAVRILVSELVANGVKYGGRGGRIRLELEVRDDCVHVEIGDRGQGFDPETVSMPDEDSTSGRGLAILDRMAERWGVERGGENRVWFELPLQ